MEVEMVLEEVERIKAGKLPMKELIGLTRIMADLAVKLEAIQSCVKDGTIYQATVKSKQEYAYLHWVLLMAKELGKQVEDGAKGALNGTDEKVGADGHSRRFAEFIRELGESSFKMPVLGTFTITPSMDVFPPSQKDPEKYQLYLEWLGRQTDERKCLPPSKGTLEYDNYHHWLSEHPEFAKPEINWKSLQTLVKELQAQDAVPEFISVKTREEVKFTKSRTTV